MYFKNICINILWKHVLARSYCLEAKLPVLTLFTNEKCQLCDEALEKLSPHLSKVKLEIVDIEDDGREKEYDKFKYEIPVFFLNKKFLCKNNIDFDKFHSALKDYQVKLK